jgi:hypothetical protein
MKTAFIIRFHYEENDPRFEWRFNYFVDAVLPRIKAQTVQVDDICIRCNAWHKDRFEKLGLKTFYVKDEFVKYKDSGTGKKYFHDFVSFDRVVGLEKYDVQFGLDSDDLIEPDYVSLMIAKIEQYADRHPGKSLHLCFQPQTINIRNGKAEIKPMREYTPTRGSAFMSLFQPDKENYTFVYCESHMTLWKHADASFVLPVGYCMATIHDINESTGK